MLTFLNPRQSAFLADLDRIQTRSEKAQRQLSSGLRMNSIADHPDQIGVLLQSRAELASTQQTQANLSRAKTEVDAGENAIQNIIKAVERVRVLGAQGLTGTQSASSRGSISGEVEALFKQIVSIANTAIDGRYIFAGSADQSPPYSVDLTQASGVTPYAGGDATRQIRDASGVRIPISRTGQELFDSATPGRNAFASVKSLRDALLANDETAIQTAVSDIGTSLEHLNEQLAYFGSTQNMIAEASNAAGKKALSLQTQIADTEGADLAESILELQESATHRQAALQAKGQEDRRTVFDFLR
jgi:flagellar hook-associated protein 3 FlgL